MIVFSCVIAAVVSFCIGVLFGDRVRVSATAEVSELLHETSTMLDVAQDTIREMRAKIREQESRFNKLNEEHHVRIRKLIWKNGKCVEALQAINCWYSNLYKNPSNSHTYSLATRCLDEICNPPNGQKNLPPDWTNYKTFPEPHEEDASHASNSSSVRSEDD